MLDDVCSNDNSVRWCRVFGKLHTVKYYEAMAMAQVRIRFNRV